jgi:chromosomal replication initiator protein
MQRKKTSARTLALPENRSAFLAVDELIAHVQAGRASKIVTPLFIHGPAGTGKSHLVEMLVRKITLQVRDLIVTVLPAGDFQPPMSAQEQEISNEVIDQARTSDLWVLEDLHHLSLRAVEPLVQVLEHRNVRRLPTVITAQAGPRHLAKGTEGFPARLTSRLAAGLVVALEPWQPASRLLFLEELAQRRQFAVAPGIFAWLAEKLPGSGRVLEGAMNHLEALARQNRGVLELQKVQDHFRTQTEAHQPTMERIAEQVSGYFRLEPDLLKSRSRYRNIMLPRQVSMYLARILTRLSLDQIGDFFGGRDHTTVLHACRKVERVLEEDPVLSGAVKQLHAQLA